MTASESSGSNGSNGRAAASKQNGRNRRGKRTRGIESPIAIPLEILRRHGQNLSSQLGRIATAPADGIREKATAIRTDLERRLSEQLGQALDRFGIPTHARVASLEQEIARVSSQLDELEKRAGARGARARRAAHATP